MGHGGVRQRRRVGLGLRAREGRDRGDRRGPEGGPWTPGARDADRRERHRRRRGHRGRARPAGRWARRRGRSDSRTRSRPASRPSTPRAPEPRSNASSRGRRSPSSGPRPKTTTSGAASSRTDPRLAEPQGPIPDDLPGPDRTVDDHHQSRRPGARVPARRADPGRRGRLLHPRHPVHLGLRDADQRGPPAAPELGADPVLLVAVRVHERCAGRHRRPDPSPVAGPPPGPDRGRRRARGLRPRQLLAATGPADRSRSRSFPTSRTSST